MEVVGDLKEQPVGAGLQREMPSGKVAKRRKGPGDLERTQRKRARSLGETNSSTKMMDVVRESVAAGATGGKTSGGKRKRSKVAVEAVEIAKVEEVAEQGYDSEHVINAAQALFELFGGGSSVREEKPSSTTTTTTTTQDVKWAGKKSRSSRSTRKMEDESINNSSKMVSSSGATSATVTDNPEVSESSGSQNPNIGVSAAVKTEEEAVNRAEDSETEGRSVILNPYVGLELGLGLSLGQSREHKLLSQSSLESTFPNSRVESPSSPLPIVGPDAVLTPKLEEELMAQFGFPRTIAIRPVKNASNVRKSKAVEEKGSVGSLDFNDVKVNVKQVQRRKPRASSNKFEGHHHHHHHQQQQQQQHHHHHHHHHQLQLEVADETLHLQTASSASLLKECSEENKSPEKTPELATLNLFEPVKQETVTVKIETGTLCKAGSSTQSRLRSALSEAEKEARRLRRVQANRESARQTIRRKQVLCEELASKAADLQAEKDDLTQKMEVVSRELRDQMDLNRHLKEQLALQAGSKEKAPTPTRPGSTGTPPAASIASGGLPMLPYWWAFAFAQSLAASQSSAPQGGEGALLAPEINSMLGATLTAFNNGKGMDLNSWMSMMGSLSNIIPFAGKIPASEEHSSLTNTSARPSTSLESPMFSPQKSVDLMAGGSVRSLVSGKSYPSSNYREGCPSSGSMEGVMKSDSCIGGSRLQGHENVQVLSTIAFSKLGDKVQGTGMTPATMSLGLHPRSIAGMVESNAVRASASSSSPQVMSSCQQALPGQMEHMRKSANLGFYPSIGNGVHGFLGPSRGNCQPGSAALATEARRRRRELKRTKSLQSKQQGKRLTSTRTL